MDQANQRASISRFEDLIVWQRARELTKRLYQLSSQGLFARDFRLKDQVRSAAVSVMANIAEGFERGGRAEFHQFLSMAKASCGEVRSGLYVAMDAGYLTAKDFSVLLGLSQEVGRMLGRMRRSVAEQRSKR